VEIDLTEAGLDIEWEDVHVPNLDGIGIWDEAKRPYWALKIYKLPTCQFMG
jgi:type IV protein arginine methyltransferase